jgi:hypothetical protein
LVLAFEAAAVRDRASLSAEGPESDCVGKSENLGVLEPSRRKDELFGITDVPRKAQTRSRVGLRVGSERGSRPKRLPA